MLRVNFLFAVSTTYLVLVIFDDSSLMIGVQVWSLISIKWLSLSLTSTDAMALYESPVEQRHESKLSSLKQKSFSTLNSSYSGSVGNSQ